MMELKITSVLAKWNNFKYLAFRSGKEGLHCIEKVLKDHFDSDFLFFPGGFILEIEEREKIKSDLMDLCSDYKGVLITGFDEDTPASPLIIKDNNSFTFKQAAITNKDVVKKKYAKQKRFFEYKDISFAVLSCGEIFNKAARDIIFDDKIPELLFDCLHTGRYLRQKPLRKLIDNYCSCAGFYNFHSNSTNLIKINLSGADIKEIKDYNHLFLSTINYLTDTSKQYKFKLNKK